MLDTAGATTVALAYVATLVLRGPRGGWRDYDLLYNAPLVVPVVLFVLDRLRRRSAVGCARLGVDTAVVALAASRMVVPIPLLSGHTLFLVYALLTTWGGAPRGRWGVAPLMTAAVLLEVTVIKLAVWRDPSWFGGALVGTVASRAFTRWLAPER